MLLYQCPQTNPQRVLGQRVTGGLGARSNRVSCPKNMVVINCGTVAESTISNVTNDWRPKLSNVLMAPQKANKRVHIISTTCVSSQLTADAHIAFTSLQAVDGANVIQASAGHVVSWGSVSTCHHPGWAQWDSMDLKTIIVRCTEKHLGTNLKCLIFQHVTILGLPCL